MDVPSARSGAWVWSATGPRTDTQLQLRAWVPLYNAGNPSGSTQQRVSHPLERPTAALDLALVPSHRPIA